MFLVDDDAQLIEDTTFELVHPAQDEISTYLDGTILSIEVDWESAETLSPSLVPDFATGINLIVAAIREAAEDGGVKRALMEFSPILRLMNDSTQHCYGVGFEGATLTFRTNLFSGEDLPSAQEFGLGIGASSFSEIVEQFREPEEQAPGFFDQVADFLGGFVHACLPFQSLGHKEAIKLAEALDVASRDGRGNTALHICAQYGMAEIAHLLCRRGAAFDATNNAGETPIVVAVTANQREVVGVLIRHGADAQTVRPQNPDLEQLLEPFRTGESDPSAIKLPEQFQQLDAMIDGTDQDDGGSTGGLAEFGEFLELTFGAVLDMARGANRGPALHQAVVAGMAGNVALQLTQPKSIEATNETGQSALHVAVLKDSPELIEQLLNAGASPHFADRSGATPAMWANWLGVDHAALSEANGEPTAQVLMDMIDTGGGGESPEIFQKVTEWIGRIGAAKEILDSLTLENPMRLEIYQQVFAQSGPAVLDALLERVRQPNDHSAAGAMIAAETLGDVAGDRTDEVREALVQLVRREDLDRTQIQPPADMLDQMPPEMLNDFATVAQVVVAGACGSLGKLGTPTPEALDALAGLMGSDCARIQEAAAGALAQFGSAGSATLLKNMSTLSDPSAALKAISERLTDECPDDTLIELFAASEDSWVQRSVAEKLRAWLESNSDSLPLARLAIDYATRDDMGVRWEASAAVEAAESFPNGAIDMVLETMDREKGGAALTALTKMEVTDELGGQLGARLAPLTQCDDYELRNQATDALVFIGRAAGSVEDTLIAYVLDEDCSNRDKAARALGAVGQSDRAVDALESLLKEQTLSGSKEAAQALGEMGGIARRTIPTLESFADDFFAGEACRNAIAKLAA